MCLSYSTRSDHERFTSGVDRRVLYSDRNAFDRRLLPQSSTGLGGLVTSGVDAIGLFFFGPSKYPNDWGWLVFGLLERWWMYWWAIRSARTALAWLWCHS